MRLSRDISVVSIMIFGGFREEHQFVVSLRSRRVGTLCWRVSLVDGRLRSLQRQLLAYGFKMDVHTYFHPQFHRRMDEEDMILIQRKSRIGIDASEGQSGKKRKRSLRNDSGRSEKVARRSSTGSSKTFDDQSTESLTNFPQTIHNMLEEIEDPAIMKWTAEGKAFTIDPDHPDLGDVLEKYFQREFLLCLQLLANDLSPP
jgi:hypothetical protein